MTPTYRDTITVLSRYLSQVNAQLALDRALRRADLTPESYAPKHVATVLPHLQRTLNLFVEPTRLPALFAELGHNQAPPRGPEVVEVTNEADVSEARLQARMLCQEMGASTIVSQKVATLVSELARNIVLYAKKGKIEMIPQHDPPKRVIVKASDQGPGIPNLPDILAGNYRSKTGMGMGLRGSKRLANRFDIESNERGTRIEAEINF